MRVALKDPEIERILDNSPRAASMVIGPTGDQIGDAMRQEEGILYALIDLSASVEFKQLHDVAGYYNRFDIFKLTVDRSSNRPITFEPMSFNAQASTGLVQKEEARV
jgi:nitrilase